MLAIYYLILSLLLLGTSYTYIISVSHNMDIVSVHLLHIPTQYIPVHNICTILLRQVKAMSTIADKMQERFNQHAELLSSRGMWKVYQLELAVVPLLIVMECKGLRVDINQFHYVDNLLSVIKPLLILSLQFGD